MLKTRVTARHAGLVSRADVPTYNDRSIMSESVPPPLPPPVPVPVQTLTYSASSKGGRPGVITAIGVIAIVVACLSGITSFLTCMYGAVFFTFMPMWASAAAAGGPGSASGPGTAAVAADRVAAGEVSVAVNTLQSVLELDGRRVRELDNLLRLHGRDVLGKPDNGDDPTPGPITDAWLRESVSAAHPAAGSEAVAWFSNAQGRVEIFPDHAVFTSRDRTRTIETSAARHTHSESNPVVEENFEVVETAPATGPSSLGGTTLSTGEIRRVMKAVKASALRPLTPSQLKAIEQQISFPNQDLVTPGAVRPVAAVTQTASAVVVQFDGAVLNVGSQGQIVSSFSTSSFAPKLAMIRPPLALLVVESALSLALAVYLLVAGILVFRSSFKSPRLLRIYALAKIPLALVGVVAIVWLIHRGSTLAAAASGGGSGAGFSFRTLIPVGIWFAVSVAYAVGVLICLRTRRVRAFFNSVSS
jgi:hypothetical protein